MSKQDFLNKLKAELSGLSAADMDERLAFYAEMIDDRMEDGLTEEEAVAAIGTVEDIAAQIIADIPFSRIARERIKPSRRLRGWEIALLVMGVPLWLPLGIAAMAIIVAVYASLWSVIISLWAVFASLACCGPCGVAAGVYFAISGTPLPGIVTVGAGLVCAGLAIFAFFGCKAATVGTLRLTRKVAIGIKKSLIAKEGA